MATASGRGADLQVNVQELRQAGTVLAELSAAVRALAARESAAQSLAASACPGWETGAASSAAGARWQQAVTTVANGVAGASDNVAASAASYESAEIVLIRKISAIGGQAGR